MLACERVVIASIHGFVNFLNLEPQTARDLAYGRCAGHFNDRP